jgi:hypothetical protein
MKKTVFISLFVFSLALNLAVAATLGWHLWQDNSARLGQDPSGPVLSDDDLRRIRHLWMSSRPEGMMEIRTKIMEKQLDLVDQIAKHPGRPEVADQQLKELAALRTEMEKQAVARISRTLAELPQEKRQAFVAFLKTRSCMGPGMGMRRQGRGGMGPCPARTPLGE